MAADSLGLGSRIGSIAAGDDADLVAVERRSDRDITAVRKFLFVMHRGAVVARRTGSTP